MYNIRNKNIFQFKDSFFMPSLSSRMGMFICQMSKLNENCNRCVSSNIIEKQDKFLPNKSVHLFIRFISP